MSGQGRFTVDRFSPGLVVHYGAAATPWEPVVLPQVPEVPIVPLVPREYEPVPIDKLQPPAWLHPTIDPEPTVTPPRAFRFPTEHQDPSKWGGVRERPWALRPEPFRSKFSTRRRR
ncbi:MAG: hypothetical protein HOW73_43555 [Polyangiaceae bacterium]|nr:hypothetical protein [Polyangiaceae bacterium]